MNLIQALAATSALLIGSSDTEAQDGQLAGSEWRPVAIAGEPVAAETTMFVQFRASGEFLGHGGCNRFSGKYEIEDEGISIGPLSAARMACPPPVMTLEDAFLARLQQAERFERHGFELIVYDDGDVAVLRLTQTDAD